eukprot:m.111993 g.111993  ORF g.111993 m.111993 type:complete len:106 (-) comp28157_c3_seq1:61-378(-)
MAMVAARSVLATMSARSFVKTIQLASVRAQQSVRCMSSESDSDGLRGKGDGILNEPTDAGAESLTEFIEVDGQRVNRKTGEIGGPKGPEPTRYGDWEQKGRCSDF